MNLDKDFISKVDFGMNATWQAIGFDVIDVCEDNEQAMEMCIDSDRLLLNGDDPEAHVLVRQACAEHGYNVVLAFLSKHFHFV